MESNDRYTEEEGTTDNLDTWAWYMDTPIQ